MIDLLRRLRGPSPRTQKAYESLVIRVADGKQPIEDVAGEVLDGRAVEDFQADVERLLKRRAAAADLKAANLLQQEHAKLQADVRAAKAAIDNHPIQKALVELQQLGVRHDELQAAAMRQGGEAARLHGQAMHVLFKTASKAIAERSAETTNKIGALQNQLRQIALTSAESSEYRTAQKDVAELPARIADVGGGERATLTARLLKQRQAMQQFADRMAEVARIEAEIAKLSEDRDREAAAEQLVPEKMEFTSRPKPREL